MCGDLNALTESIIAVALEVHRDLGPGLLEQWYEASLAFELSTRGMRVKRQKALPALLVEDVVIVDVKAIERLEPVHAAQLLSCLRLAHCPVGLLFNFNATCLTRDGLTRVVNGLQE
jgi:hypothetical protein